MQSDIKYQMKKSKVAAVTLGCISAFFFSIDTIESFVIAYLLLFIAGVLVVSFSRDGN